MTDDASARLGLPYLAAGQLQKHVTLNETLTRLDALIQAAAISRSTAAQPAAPAEGALYILPSSPSGPVWAGRSAGDLMRFEAGGWSAVAAPEGMVVWIVDEATLVVRDDGVWLPLGQRLKAVQGLTRLGLNTTADATNPFAARINKALWTAINTDDGGDGDLRMTFNKEGASDVLSLLFQSGWGGRAELGLIGDDDLTLKVSADGAAWRSALTIDRMSGAASFPGGCGRVETTILTSSATWAAPAWARRIEAVVVGGGGGGGSGAAGVSGTIRFGGGGGGAGGVCAGAWAAADLADGLTVTVGGPGTGATSASSGSGFTGGGGGTSLISSGGVALLRAPGGSGGQGGGAASGGGGAGGAGFPVSNGGGASSVTATAATGFSLVRPDASGGGGGGLDAANTPRSGGGGGAGGTLATVSNGGAGGAATGSAGVAASAPARSWAGGGGGGGGASTAAGYAGGPGAAGAGGGGGGAGVTASGPGGAGGAGLVRLTVIG